MSPLYFFINKLKSNLKSQNITKAINQQKDSDCEIVSKKDHSKLINKTKLKNKTSQIYKKNEGPRKEIFILKKCTNSNGIIKSKPNYDLRKQFKVSKNKIQIIIINFLFLFKIIINNNRFFDSFYFSNEITLKIRGTGNKKILSNSFSSDNYPQKIFINENNLEDITYQYNFMEEENIVILTWEHKITNCEKMFRDCSDINEMDLSKFDSSDVTDMKYMFAYFSSLTSINLSNLNTENVERLYCMFRHCSSLTSIDVSSFITNKVTYIQHMFNECESLTSINLANFHTPLVNEVAYMFQDCKNLEYINLTNFNGTHISNLSYSFYKGMFENIPKNVVI